MQDALITRRLQRIRNVAWLAMLACLLLATFTLPVHAVTNITDIQSIAEQKISDTAGYLSNPGSPGSNPGGLLDPGDYFGSSAASLGDFDGDGIADLAIGAQDYNFGVNRGAVYLLFLNADATVKARQKISDTVGGFTGVLDNGDVFGSALANLGDLDGDGIQDLAVGARWDSDGALSAGAVWVLFLNADGTVKSHQKISNTVGGFTGVLDNSDNFGTALANLGDLDGDGVTDLAVGSHKDDDGGTDRGAVWILFLNANGTVKSHQKISETNGGFTGVLDNSDEFGIALANLGDLNGDGVTDLAVGSPRDDDGGSGRGAVWTLFLNANGTVKSHQKISDTTGGFTGMLSDVDAFGGSIETLGDLDGDGIQDLAVGARWDDDGGTDRGAVWLLLLNADGTVKDQYRFSDTVGGFTGVLDNYDLFGTALASLGDMNGNGVPELAVGAPWDDDGGANQGAVWTLFLDTVRTPVLLDIQGTAQGGSVQITVDGIVVSITTVAAQTAGQVVANLVAAINTTQALQDRGVSATANGAQLSTNGLLSNVLVNDAGLLAQADLDVDLTATLLVDANSNGFADPGDELRMLATITNTGFGPVSNAVFTSPASLDAPLIAGTIAAIGGTITQGNTGGDTAVTVALDSLPVGGSAAIAYRRQIANPLPAGINYIHLSDVVELSPSQIQVSDDPSTPEVGDPVIIPVGDGGILVYSAGKISDTAGYLTSPGTPGSNPGGLLNQDDGFAISAASGGDFDGDGIADLAVGAFRDDDGGTDLGAVYLLLLNADGTVKSQQVISATSGGFTGILGTDDTFGLGLDWLGDLDGDGVQDLAVGARNDDDGSFNRGAVWILFLNADGTVKAHQKISDTAGGFTGVLDNQDRMGVAIRALGDLDGDGVTDLAVGMPSDDDTGPNRGSIWIMFLNADGTVKGHQKISDAVGGFTGVLGDGDLFGDSIEVLGDLDGDGVVDLAVGADTTDDGGVDRGAVWILFLNANGTVKGHQKISSTAGGFTGTLQDSDYFGYRVASLGDLDSDGLPELAVGSFGNDDGGADRGAVWILSLNADGTVKDQRRISNTVGAFTGILDDGDNFGTALSSLSDMSGNGLPELAVGAWHDDDGGTDRGAVWTLFLRSFNDLSCTGNPALCVDADSDGIPDAIDPYPADTDNDGLDNVIDPDDDNDGIPDNVEVTWGLNTLDAADAYLDLDNDTFDNLAEYRAGTSLSNPAENPGTVTDLHYKILASDGEAGEAFGLFDSHSVAIDGDTALVGVWTDSDLGQDSGSVYAFQRADNGTWVEQSKLLAGDGAANNKFGHSVALSGDTALVGAPFSNGVKGAAYVFIRDSNGNWLQQDKLEAIDGASADQFGQSVSIDGDTALIGAFTDGDNGLASGSAYIFKDDGAGNWSQQDKLIASDGVAGDWFGVAVSLHGSTALIGAPEVDDQGSRRGSAYVFTDDGAGNWMQQAELSSLNAKVDNNQFGISVSVNGDTALVGSKITNEAYVFLRDAQNNWAEQAILSPGDGTPNDNFGNSVSLEGDLALVGAHADDDKGSQSGSAYLFTRDSGGSWTQWKKLLAGDGEASDRFGKSVALDSGTVLASAYGDDDNGIDAGAAYIIEVDQAAPTEVTNNVVIKAGSGNVATIGSSNLLYSDDIQAPADITYTVTSGPVNGQLELTTNPGIAITIFTQADIDNNRLIYVRTDLNAFFDSITFVVDDGKGNVSSQGIFNIGFDPVHHYNFERTWPTLASPWYFRDISSVATDANGNVYVLDQGNNRIHKFNKFGIEETSWPAAIYSDPTGPRNSLHDWALTVAEDGRIYALVETEAGPIKVRRFTSDGKLDTNGIAPGDWLTVSQTGLGGWDIEAAPNGNIWVLAGNGNIYEHSPSGVNLSTITTNAERFAMDSSGNIYTINNSNNVLKYSPLGGQIGSPWSITDSPGNTGTQIRDIQVDRNNAIWIGSTVIRFGFPNYRVQKYDANGIIDPVTYIHTSTEHDFEHFTVAISSDDYYLHKRLDFNDQGSEGAERSLQVRNLAGYYKTEWTSRGTTGIGVNSPYMFNQPAAIATNPTNQDIVVADKNNQRVKIFNNAGAYQGFFSTTQPSTFNPMLVAADNLSIFVGDFSGLHEYTLQGQNYTYSQTWNTVQDYQDIIAQNGLLYYLYRDPTNETGSLDDHVKVKSSPATNVRDHYFTDQSGNAVPDILRFAVDGVNVYALVADSVTSSYWVHKQTAVGVTFGHVQLDLPWVSSDVYDPMQPTKFRVDGDGFIFVSDPVTRSVIRFTPDGNESHRFGNTGNAVAQIEHPAGFSLDNLGRVFVADTGLNRVQIYRPVVQADTTKAIIVAGGGPYPGNSLWSATQAMANKAYSTLLRQGFDDNSILYLSDGVGSGVDQPANAQNLQDAIEVWAGEDADGDNIVDAQDVIIYMDNHGGDQAFRVNKDEVLTRDDLDVWLNTMEGKITGNTFLIMDSCQSGSFTPLAQYNPVTDQTRVVVTSAADDEVAYFTSQGLMSFSNYFLNNILGGMGLGDAFSAAWQGVNNDTTSQIPQIDANGDGTTNAGFDPVTGIPLGGGDYADAQALSLGSGTNNYLDGPTITSASVTIVSGSTATISANGVSDPDGIGSVWAVVYPPNPPAPDPDNPVTDLPTVELKSVSGNYSADYSGFTSLDTYQVAVYAKDVAGNSSAPMITSYAPANPLARQAIIMAGPGAAYEQAADSAYQALRTQGYTDNEIRYRSASGLPGVDGSPTIANLQADLASMNGTNTGDATLFLIGSSDGSAFALNGTETLAASTLDGWLDTVVTAIPGKLTVVMDADNAGLYLTRLSAPIGEEMNLLRLASTVGGAAYFGGAGSVSYTQFLVGNIANGATLPAAHELAKRALDASTNGQQRAWLDSNSDDVSDKDDLERIEYFSLGPGILLAGDAPTIGNVGVVETDLNGDPMQLTLWAQDITTTGTIASVWAVVTPPDIDGYGGTEPVAVEVPLVESPAGSNYYTGAFVLGDGAANPQPAPPGGTYSVSFYAQDNDDAVSLPSSATVTRQDAYEPDDAHTEAKDIGVDDGTVHYHSFHTTTDVDWAVFYHDEAQNPTTQYTIEADTLGSETDIVLTLADNNGATLVGPRDGTPAGDYPFGSEVITYTPTQTGFYKIKVSLASTGEALTDYVLSVSKSGGGTGSHISVEGIVEDENGAPLLLAQVIANGPASGWDYSFSDGRYALTDLPDGTYNLTAQKCGYNTVNVGTVNLDNGGTAIRNIAFLQPVVADCDFDGVLDDVDNCPGLSDPDQTDTDGDGMGNPCDSDDDNDGIPDVSDTYPLDTDNDGLDNVVDDDDDNDGFTDAEEIAAGTDPLDPNSFPDPGVPGDVTGDNVVNVADLLVCTRIMLGLDTTTDGTPCDVAPRDAGGVPQPDGQLNAGDIAVLQQMVLQ